LKEIQAHDPDVEQVLSSEYQYILSNAAKLRAAHRRQPNYLDRLYGMQKLNLGGLSTVFVQSLFTSYCFLLFVGMITDLYIDKYKYNGANVKNRVPLLMDVLDKQDFDALVDFFQTPIHVSHDDAPYSNSDSSRPSLEY